MLVLEVFVKINALRINNRDVILDAVKGVLILLIALEHNSFMYEKYTWIRPFTDAFAAGGFLVITFIWPIKYKSLVDFLDKVLSYLVPFFWFVVITSILNFIMYSNYSYYDFFINLFRALFIASPSDIKTSTGFMLFWFLPCLTMLYIFRLFHHKLGKLFLVIPILSVVLIGSVPEYYLLRFPYSLHVICFVYIAGYMYSNIHSYLIRDDKIIKLLMISIFIVLSVGSHFIGWELFLSGGMIPNYTEFYFIVFYFLFHLLCIPGIYHIISIMPKFLILILSYLGGISLKIFLIHQLIFIAITQILGLVVHAELSYVLTILLTVLVIYFMDKIPPIDRFIFPKKISTLLGGKF
jgi:fucose 4-O-acetylase-like acetyltransferase